VTRTLYLCGAGNSEGVRLALGIEVEARRFDRLVVLDDDPARRGQTLLGVEIAGGFEVLAGARAGESAVANLVARTTARRAAARDRIAAYGLPFATLIHPRVDTLGAELAQDLIVYQNATIGPEVRIGEGSVVFMGAVVGHECRVGAGCVVAANAVLNARVELARGVYVGTNATVLPEVRVGAWATVGAGSVVIEDVPPGATVMGVPARVLTDMLPGNSWNASSARGVAGDPEIERRLRAIWQELLGPADVDAEANFFDLGGSSLLALRMRDRNEREFGRSLDLTDLFRFPSLRGLARRLSCDEPARLGASAAARRVAFRRERALPGRALAVS
jgi:sugar O-acyltransferase (sialic acid O-acetyltransferase NeuD family)